MEQTSTATDKQLWALMVGFEQMRDEMLKMAAAYGKAMSDWAKTPTGQIALAWAEHETERRRLAQGD